MEWGKQDPSRRLKMDVQNLEDRANGLWQLIQELKEALGDNETKLSPSGSPTFARVITPRVDNAGGALQLNPAGGNVLVGTPEGDTAGQKALFADSNQFTRIGVENLSTGAITKYSYYSALARSTAGTRKEAGTIFWESDADVNNSGAGITTRSGNAAVTGFSITPAGYVKLGADAGAPGTKTKELTGTTSGSQGGVVSVAHGLTASKILDVALSVDYSGAGTGFVPSNHSFSAGFNVDLAWGTTNIDVLNVSGNPVSVLSKAFKLFITYKE